MSFNFPRLFYVDNVPITAGSGTPVASDDIGGVQHQRVKVEFGVDGVATDVSATNPLPVVQIDSELFKGRAMSFRTTGRAGTAGQKIMSIFNAVGSAVTLTVDKIFVDILQTAIIAVTVQPVIIRMWKVTVLPTNGTALAKTKIDGTATSNASITVLGDASADSTLSATTLTATLPAGAIVSQEFAPRLITAAGYEMADRLEFFGDSHVVLAAGEGLVVYLDYTLVTSNPATNFWIAGIEWDEN